MSNGVRVASGATLADSLCPGVKREISKDRMHSRTPPRNRLAKPLPEEWRKLLVERGVPKRKYTAVLRATLVGGRVIENLIVEEGWIIATTRDGPSMSHTAGMAAMTIAMNVHRL